MTAIVPRCQPAVMASILEELECPVCFEVMSNSIFSCKDGHSVCDSCERQLQIDCYYPACPVCRSAMPRHRNRALERIAGKLCCICFNENCSFEGTLKQVKSHQNHCQFRDISCPTQMDCHWTGKVSNVVSHMKEKHNAHDPIPESQINLSFIIDLNSSNCDCLIFSPRIITCNEEQFLFQASYDKDRKEFVSLLRCITIANMKSDYQVAAWV